MSTILVVEDCPVTAWTMVRMLKRRFRQHIFLHVEDGGSALALLAQGDVAMVVLDFTLPDMTGLELLERPLEIVPPVIMITANGMDLVGLTSPFVRRAFTKPVSYDVLIAAIEECLAPPTSPSPSSG